VFGTHDLGLFALTVLVLNATPGVDMAFTLMSTLRGGVRAGLAAAAGIGAGCAVHALAATFGLAALMAASAAAFNAIKWVGAAYLLWLAAGMLRTALARGPAATSMPATATAAAPPSPWAVMRQGFLTNVLNPKVALFSLALLPQFIDADAPGKTLAFLFLGLWSVLQGLLFLAVFVLLVAPLRRMPARPMLVRGLHLAGAGLFGALAVRLASSARP
jgi:threonine/homoserine/homoserine lactone efflux protein